MTVKDQDGKTVFSKTKEYAVYDLHLPSNKEGYLGLNDWDITAMKHFDLGIKPHKTDAQTFIIPLTKGTKSVEVDATFKYFYESGQTNVIKKVSKKVTF